MLRSNPPHEPLNISPDNIPFQELSSREHTLPSHPMNREIRKTNSTSFSFLASTCCPLFAALLLTLGACESGMGFRNARKPSSIVRDIKAAYSLYDTLHNHSECPAVSDLGFFCRDRQTKANVHLIVEDCRTWRWAHLGPPVYGRSCKRASCCKYSWEAGGS